MYPLCLLQALEAQQDEQAAAFLAALANNPDACPAEAAAAAGLLLPGTPIEVSRLLIVPGAHHSMPRVQVATRSSASGSRGFSITSRSSVFDAVSVAPATASEQQPVHSGDSSGEMGGNTVRVLESCLVGSGCL